VGFPFRGKEEKNAGEKPGLVQASASARMLALYAALKVRLLALG
jgi:hypothetical protein